LFNLKSKVMNYIGIDVSKAKLDLALLDGTGKVLKQAVVKNTAQAIRGNLQRWEHEFGLDRSECLACFEPTGSYSDTLMRTLLEAGVPAWKVHPMELKQRMGMVRGKNDKVDALRIADHAMRYYDKKRLVGHGALMVMQLKHMLAYRRRLVVDHQRHQSYKSEVYPYVTQGLRSQFSEYSSGRLSQMAVMIKELDVLIKSHILAHPVMSTQYRLLLGVERIGHVLAMHLIAATEAFTRMCVPRELACHAGVAPHEHTSGSSIHGKARVSHKADKKLKTALHMAVLGVTQGRGELGAYYMRKVAEGKSPSLVLNAVCNKVIHRACAVIKRGTPFIKRTPASKELAASQL
jgi:transposase